jgi:hypothetical protein
MPEGISSPLQEARGLLPLLRNQSADEIRQSIGDSDPFRRETLRFFDSLYLRLSAPALRRGRIRLLGRSGGKFQPSPQLEAEILKRLQSGVSMDAVARDLQVPHSVVRRISKTNRLAYAKHGRGRRFSREQNAELVAALRAGAIPAELMRRHRVCAEKVRKLRREYLHDFTDRRKSRKDDIKGIKKALVTGLAISEVERIFAIPHRNLWELRRKKLGDFEDRRRGNRLIISQVQRAEIEAAIRTGLSLDALREQFHHHQSLFQKLRVQMGLAPKKRRFFTLAERNKIIQAIATGQPIEQITKQMDCRPGTIWMVKTRMLRGEPWKTTNAG